MAVKTTAGAAVGRDGAQTQDEKPPRAAQSVKLPEPLRQRLRLWAVFLNREISELVEEAVATRLDTLDRERAERGLPPLPQPENETDERPEAGGDRRPRRR